MRLRRRDDPSARARRRTRMPGGCAAASASGRALHQAMLDDYANLARAAGSRSTRSPARPAYLAAGAESAGRRRRPLAGKWDAAGGRLFLHRRRTPEGLIARTKTAHDNATPSNSGVMAGDASRPALFPDRQDRLSRPRRGDHQRRSPARPPENFFPAVDPAQRAADFLARSRCRSRSSVRIPATCRYRNALLRGTIATTISLPNLVLQIVTPGYAELPAGHPARGKGQVGGKATAYLCEGPVCSLPLTDAGRRWPRT